MIKSQGLGNKHNLRKYYYEKQRSQTFINHCLLIAKICCLLEEKNTASVTYAYVTDSDMVHVGNAFHFLKEADLPIDVYFSKKQKGKKMQHYLVSLFDVSYPLYRIRKRIKVYYQFYFSNAWENAIDTSFPNILLIFSSKHHMISAKRFTKKLLEQDDPENFSIFFAMAEEVKIHGVTGEIWEGI